MTDSAEFAATGVVVDGCAVQLPPDSELLGVIYRHRGEPVIVSIALAGKCLRNVEDCEHVLAGVAQILAPVIAKSSAETVLGYVGCVAQSVLERAAPENVQ